MATIQSSINQALFSAGMAIRATKGLSKLKDISKEQKAISKAYEEHFKDLEKKDPKDLRTAMETANSLNVNASSTSNPNISEDWNQAIQTTSASEQSVETRSQTIANQRSTMEMLYNRAKGVPHSTQEILYGGGK